MICSEKLILLKLWPYLIQAIAHIKNRTYNSIINKTPYEALTGNKPNISYIRILGSLAYILDPKEVRNKTSLGKFSNKANKGILIGFRSSKNFIIYIPIINQIIDSSSFIIKEDLKYKDDFVIIEDYSNLLEPESTDSKYIKSTSNENILESGSSSDTRPVVEIPYYRPT